VRTREEVALYVLNHKRAHLRELEDRFRITLTVNADPSMGGQQPFSIERGEQVHSIEQARAIASQPTTVVAAIEYDEEHDEVEEPEEVSEETEQHADSPESERAASGDNGSRRRRRRRRRGRHGDPRESERLTQETAAEQPTAHEDEFETGAEDDEERPQSAEPHAHGPGENGENGETRRRRRRGRRGGRRGRRGRDGDAPFANPENGHPSIEPELADAVADFGGPPTDSIPIEPVPEQPPTPAMPAAQPEQPRRRSTVREAAPVGGSPSEPMPATTPVVAEPTHQTGDDVKAEDPTQPRKTGWWSRRSISGG
jgi:ribonuclease E